MRYLILIIVLLSFSLSGFTQESFKVGLAFYERGEYSKADSVFGILLQKSPIDVNVLFNHATTRLYLGDTCKFCDEMYMLCHSYQEMDACNLYYDLCGSADTLYRDKNYLECGKKDARYTEITETHRGEDFKTVYIHDKRKKSATIVNSDYIDPIKTDIIALYKLLNDGSRLFHYSLTPPAFSSGDDVYYDYLENNPYIKECKEKLNMKKVIVGVEYVVDKIGNVRDVKIDGIRTTKNSLGNVHNISDLYVETTVDNMDALKQYIDLIIAGMPLRIPGKYRDVNVDYLVSTTISFW